MSRFAVIALCLVALLVAAPALAEAQDIQAEHARVKAARANPRAAWAQYKKDFADAAGSLRRGRSAAARSDAELFTTFEANLAAIDELNELGYGQVAYGITDLLHLTPDEVAEVRGGGVLPGSGSSQAAAAAPAGGNRKMLQTTCTGGASAFPYASVVPPAAVNWRNAGFVTAIKDQGACQSCVAHATTVASEFALLRKSGGSLKNTTLNMSEDDLMECDNTDGLNGCSGTYVDTYYPSLVCNGQLTEAQDPYDGADTNTCSSAFARTKNGVAGWAWVPTTEAALAQAVSAAPVQVGVYASGAAFQSYKSGIIGCATDAGANSVTHVINIIGYGVQNVTQTTTVTSTSVVKGKTVTTTSTVVTGWNLVPFWLAKNSWGTGWGESGFVRIAKDCGAYAQPASGTFGPLSMLSYSGIVPLL